MTRDPAIASAREGHLQDLQDVERSWLNAPQNAPAKSLLQLLQQRGVLLPIDVHFGVLLSKLEPQANLVALAGAFASRAVQTGHVCLDIAQLLTSRLTDSDGKPLPIGWPQLSSWLDELASSRLVGTPLTAEDRPLVLDECNRVYLQRYADYQRRLVEQVQARLSPFPLVDEPELAQGVLQLFEGTETEPDYQRLAALHAVNNRFTLISGGPGTGKTTTVTKILVLLQRQAQALGRPAPRIALLAPTGKAAQRLTESLRTGLSRLPLSEQERTQLSSEAATLHRALGFSQRTPTRFIHGPQNPLPADIVLVDEASMVDLALMTKLMEATSSEARLILLGDRDQLASVEAGAIFGDLFHAASSGSNPSLAKCAVHLTHSYRYGSDSSIGVMARALRDEDPDALLSALSATEGAWIDPSLLSEAELRAQLRDVVLEGYADFARQVEPGARLDALDRFRVLCAHRRGRFGVEALNRLIEEVLQDEQLLDPRGHHYDNRPILISQNDYGMALFNGDIGVVCQPASEPRATVFFKSLAGSRQVQTARLPAHETVFAMTVHKSQGSEFDRVLVVLPDDVSPLVSRELLYTAITRAKRRVSVVASRAVLYHAVKTPIERASGLRDALAGRST